MRYAFTATVTFGAGHHLPADSWCGDKQHGHQYEVRVTMNREGYPDKDLIEWSRARASLLELALELKNRDLTKMLGAQVPNVFGVAAFFMERLSINFPVTRVEVREDSDPVAIIERDDVY